MVDVSEKPITRRTATAEGFVTMSSATLQAIVGGNVPKGEVLNTARIAGILAAKRCGELIPLCHPLPIDAVGVDFDELPDTNDKSTQARIRIRATATISARTGVEMEALTAVSVAALTIYDMCKAIDRGMTITQITLIEKTGGAKPWPGKSGTTII